MEASYYTQKECKSLFFKYFKHFISVFSFFFFTHQTLSAQELDCGTLNCTSNDVQIARAYLRADLGGNPLDPTCVSGSSVQAYLFLELSTNTPRVGVNITANIRNKNGGALVEDLNQCFSQELKGTSTIVKFLEPVNWICGTEIILTDVLISWGTGKADFCGGQTAPRCPETKSKCWRQPPTQFIPIVTFPCTSPDIIAQPASTSVCLNEGASFAITFKEGSPNASIQWQVSTNGGGEWNAVQQNGTYSIDKASTNGTTTSTLGISSATSNLSGNKYRVVLTNNTEDNQCGATSDGNATLTVKSIPAAPQVSVTDNCVGSSTLSTTASGSLLWSTGATTSTITVYAAGTYTVTTTVDGCTSASGSGIAAPKTTPATPQVSVTDNCDGSSTLSTTASGSLLWSTDATTSTITVYTAGTYTVTTTVDGCTSASGSGIAAPKTTPATPQVSVTDNCDGSSTLSTTASGSLLWSTDATTSTITVYTADTYTVTTTVNECTSAAGSGIAAPKTTPAAPTVNVDDGCDGSSTLTASGYTGALLWNTNETSSFITVNDKGTYSVSQTVNGCTSASGSADANPGQAPAKAMVTYHAPACDEATFKVTVTNAATGVAYTITDKGGNNIPGVLPGNSVIAQSNEPIEFSNIPAGSGYKITAKAGFCSSDDASCGASGENQRVITQAKSQEVMVEMDGAKPQVTAFPNPFHTSVTFKLVSPVTGRVSLDVYNTSGHHVGNAFNGVLQANVPVNATFRLSKPESGILFYRMMGSGGSSVSGKIMSIR